MVGIVSVAEGRAGEDEKSRGQERKEESRDLHIARASRISVYAEVKRFVSMY